MLAIFALSLLRLSPAWAQVPGNDARLTDEFLRQQQREQQRRQQQEAQPEVRLERLPDTASGARLPVQESPCFPIKEISLQGEQAERFDWLTGAASVAGASTPEASPDSPIGSCLGTEGIRRVMNRMQNALIAKGYVTSRVLATPQDLSAGVLQITLIPGRIHTIRLDANSSSRARIRNAMPAAEGDLLNLRDIEQALENFKRVPTADAGLRILPAAGSNARPGDSDIDISWTQQRPIRFAADVNNSGSNATGRFLGSLTVSVDHGLTLNDLFYLSASRALGGGDDGPRSTQSQVLHYSLPMGYWLLGWTSSSNRFYQQIANRDGSSRYSGESHNHELRLSRIAYRDAVRKTTVSIALWARASRNFQNDVEYTLQRRRMAGWEAGLAHREHLGTAALDLNLSYRRGTGALDALRADEESSGTGTSRPQIARLGLQLSVPASALGQRWNYTLAGQAQRSHNRLIAQDQFAIGSRYTVRGFDEQNFLAADHGWTLRNELALILGQSMHQLYAGIDHGEVSGPSAGALLGRSLTGAAIGFRGALGSRSALNYEFFISTPIQKPDGFRTSAVNVGFSLGASF